MTTPNEQAYGGVRYFGGIAPRTIYRIVADDDGVIAYSAVPEEPGWELDYDAFAEIDDRLDKTIYELSREEALFLLYLWGGGHDALDAPPGEHPVTVGAARSEADGDLPRIDAFRALRDLGGKDLGEDELKIVRPRVERRAYDSVTPDASETRTDLMHDEAPLARPLPARRS